MKISNKFFLFFQVTLIVLCFSICCDVIGDESMNNTDISLAISLKNNQKVFRAEDSFVLDFSIKNNQKETVFIKPRLGAYATSNLNFYDSDYKKIRSYYLVIYDIRPLVKKDLEILSPGAEKKFVITGKFENKEIENHATRKKRKGPFLILKDSEEVPIECNQSYKIVGEWSVSPVEIIDLAEHEKKDRKYLFNQNFKSNTLEFDYKCN